MAIRKINLMPLFLVALFSLWLSDPLWAQDQSSDEGVFFPTTRYIQRLSWVGDEHALMYEVVIEKEGTSAGGEFRRVLQQFTEAVYIEVSLPPGKYRYHVIPYDAFDRPASESQWMRFEILAAIKPELDSFSPGFLLFDEETEFVVNISGKNLLRDAQIYMRQIGSSNAPVVPVAVSVEQDGSRARLRFNYGQFQPGFYVIFVKNPGGQETSKGELVIGYPDMDPNYVEGAVQTGSGNRLLDTHIGALWMPIIHMQGGMGQIFGSTLQLSSVAVRFGTFLHKPEMIFQPGLELAASWIVLKEEATGVINAETQVMTGTLYISAQRWFADDVAALTFRAGFGMGYQTGSYSDEENDPPEIYSMNGKAPHIEFGLAFLLAFKHHFTFELGLSYAHMLVKENASGYFRPFMGLGWKF